MTASLTRHLEKLCVEIGARPVGSRANDRVADDIRDVFAALGWAVEEQPYACTGWDGAAASLVSGAEALAVEANVFSPRGDATVMVVGNHEFDFGQSVLKKRISQARFPFLGANVEGMPALKPYVIKELDGIRIAIIGVVTEDAPVTTHPKNMEGLKVLPVIETVRKYVRELRKQVDVIICPFSMWA